MLGVGGSVLGSQPVPISIAPSQVMNKDLEKKTTLQLIKERVKRCHRIIFRDIAL